MAGRLLDAVPLNSLTGVGAAQSNKLAKIGLHTVQDLLLHLPLRYEDRTHLYQIGELLPGVYATVEGEVLSSNITFGGRNDDLPDQRRFRYSHHALFQLQRRHEKQPGDRPARAGLWRSQTGEIRGGDDSPGIPRAG